VLVVRTEQEVKWIQVNARISNPAEKLSQCYRSKVKIEGLDVRLKIINVSFIFVAVFKE